MLKKSEQKSTRPFEHGRPKVGTSPIFLTLFSIGVQSDSPPFTFVLKVKGGLSDGTPIQYGDKTNWGGPNFGTPVLEGPSTFLF